MTAQRAIADYFEQLARESGDPQASVNWMTTEVSAALNATGQTIDQFSVPAPDLAALLRLVRDGVVSHTAGKQIFAVMVKTGDAPATIAQRDGLIRVSDDGALTQWIDEVFAESPGEAARFVGGESRLQGVLVGRVMKKSNGCADPKRVNQLLAQLLATRLGT